MELVKSIIQMVTHKKNQHKLTEHEETGDGALRSGYINRSRSKMPGWMEIRLRSVWREAKQEGVEGDDLPPKPAVRGRRRVLFKSTKLYSTICRRSGRYSGILNKGRTLTIG